MNPDSRVLEVDGGQVPRIFYGTAWKEDQTERLTRLALSQGFRGIDTANQRRHYHEAAVGDALQSSIAENIATRSDLFLQTKFTFRRGHDHRVPYDPEAHIDDQVAQSFASSLSHLGTTTIDSYLLHSPVLKQGLCAADWTAWGAMEALHNSGQIRFLGVSNFKLDQLRILCEKARVPPRFIQNRCYAATGWDREIREFCAANGLIYQAISLLKGNQDVLTNPRLHPIAARHSRSVSQILFRFALEIGTIPLTGTTDESHMRADLDVFSFRLDADDVAQIHSVAVN